jgi:hypothetical protein
MLNIESIAILWFNTPHIDIVLWLHFFRLEAGLDEASFSSRHYSLRCQNVQDIHILWIMMIGVGAIWIVETAMPA